MAILHDVLARARAAQQKLPPADAAWLFAAVMRLAASQAATLRSRLVQIEVGGTLTLLPFDAAAPDDEPGYFAPELLEAEAPGKTEPRVQVYAAGALGYELLTGRPPPDPEKGPGAEPAGPLGDLVRVAMARDRRERFASLVELRDAVDGLQKPIPAEQERHVFAALLARSERWGGGLSDLDRAALAKLIEQSSHVHRQIEAVRVGMAEVQREQRELEGRLRKVEAGSKAPPVLVPRPRSWPAGFIGGFLGAVAAVAGMLGAGAVRARTPRGVVAALGSLASGERKDEPAARGEPARPSPAETRAQPPAPQPPAVAQAPAPSAAEAKPQTPPPSDVKAEAKPAGTEAKPPPADAPPPQSADAKPPLATPPLSASPTQLERGEVELEYGRVDAAIDAFRRAIKDEPKLAAAWRGLGTAYVLRHQNDSALAAYQKYLQLSPNAPDRADIRRAMAELKASDRATAEK